MNRDHIYEIRGCEGSLRMRSKNSRAKERTTCKDVFFNKKHVRKKNFAWNPIHLGVKLCIIAESELLTCHNLYEHGHKSGNIGDTEDMRCEDNLQSKRGRTKKRPRTNI
jgi:hypothetical protein